MEKGNQEESTGWLTPATGYTCLVGGTGLAVSALMSMSGLEGPDQVAMTAGLAAIILLAPLRGLALLRVPLEMDPKRVIIRNTLWLLGISGALAMGGLMADVMGWQGTRELGLIGATFTSMPMGIYLGRHARRMIFDNSP